MSSQTPKVDIRELVRSEMSEPLSRLAALEALMPRELSLLEENAQKLEQVQNEFKEVVSKNTSETTTLLGALKEEQKRVREKIELPWYQDRRFWGGVAAIPSLLLAGWLTKLVFQDSAMLRLIHKGFGTEAALVEAFKEESALKGSVEQSFQKKLWPGAKDLDSALFESLKAKFVPQGRLIATMGDAIHQHLSIRHVDILALGLIRPSEASWVDCPTDAGQAPGSRCLKLENAVTDTVTTLFGANPGQTLDISIGLNVLELKTAKLPVLSSSDYTETTGSTNLDSLLDVEIDDAKQKFEKQHDSYTYKVDGRQYTFAHYKLSGFKIPDKAGYNNFPMHSITVTYKKDAARNLRIGVAVIVSQAKQPVAP